MSSREPSQGADARRRLGDLVGRLALAPADAAAAYQAAEIGLDYGLEEEALPAVARVAERVAEEPRLWQMLALLYRGLEQSDGAIAAFKRAVQLAPGDVRAAHGLALATLEAGLPASALYGRALQLAPQDGTLMLGRASAFVAERRGEHGLTLLADALRVRPEWTEGHLGYARLAAGMGLGAHVTATLDAAIIARPTDTALYVARLGVLSRTALPQQRLAAVAEAKRLVGDQPALRIEEAIAASEAGELARADSLFLAIGRHADPALALAMLRHLVRARRFDEADILAGRLVTGPDQVTAWAYRQIAWRAMDDPRLQWLERGGALVQVFELEDALPLEGLANTLNAIHVGIAQPLDQSVRGGTQTEGPLFARLEPEIRAVRETVRSVVARYIAALPSSDPAHPLLSASRDRMPRFAGSWSVRLRGGGGHHVNHIHSFGWLSSALYVALPNMATGGTLTIGSSPVELGLDLPPTTTVEPRRGRLVLFPSYTWHGVTPFDSGERLTISFDVARPRA